MLIPYDTALSYWMMADRQRALRDLEADGGATARTCA
jgi:hypothetical protein